MSIQLTAWILSLVGAVAFAALGYVLGARRSREAAGAEVAMGAALEPGGEPSDRTAVAARGVGSSRGPGAPRGGAGGPRPGLSREEALSRWLAELGDAPGDAAVLADAGGLALAASGAADHEGLAALAGNSALLFGRAEELLGGAEVVRSDLRLSDGRFVQVRPVGAGEDAMAVVFVGARAPGDAEFERVRGLIEGLVGRDGRA